MNSAVIDSLRHCCIVFDFTRDPNADLDLKTIKCEILLEVINYFSNHNNVITEEMYPEAIRMISSNLFRSVTSPLSENQSEGLQDEAWLHLQFVYAFFTQLMESPNFDVAIAKLYIDQDFITRLLALFDSKDQRERISLKRIVYQLYEKFIELRPFIVKEIKTTLFKFMATTEQHNGLIELRDTFGNILTEFTIPAEEAQLADLSDDVFFDSTVDESMLIFNASDVAVIAAKGKEAIEKSLHVPPLKGILVKDSSRNPSTMNVKIIDEEKVHLIGSDHDPTTLRRWSTQ